MKRSLAGWRVPGIVLTVAVALGFVLRLAPCLRHPDFDYILDGQYHRRLVAQVVDSGRLAEIDSLSNAPGGRRTANQSQTTIPAGNRNGNFGRTGRPPVRIGINTPR